MPISGGRPIFLQIQPRLSPARRIKASEKNIFIHPFSSLLLSTPKGCPTHTFFQTSIHKRHTTDPSLVCFWHWLFIGQVNFSPAISLSLSAALFLGRSFFIFFFFFLAVLFPGWTVFCFCAQADCPGVRSFSAFLFSRYDKQNPEQRKSKKVRKNAQGKRQKRLMLSA